MAAPVPPPSQSPSKTVMGEINRDEKKHPPLLPPKKKTRTSCRYFKISFQNGSKPGRIKKNKASTNFPHLLLHLSLVWTTILQLFGHDRLQFLLQRLQILGRRPGGTGSFSLQISFTKTGKHQKNIPFIPWSTQINLPGAYGPKKKPSLDISPGMGITPFEVGSGRFSPSNCRDIPWSLFCYAVLLFHLQASNKLFHKEMYISFFQS